VGKRKGGDAVKFYGDYHTHSTSSDGRQSVEDIINAALDRGLKEIAITDHGPLAAVIGVKSAKEYIDLKSKIEKLNRENLGVRILVGAEANIRDMQGTLDIDPEVIEQLDILIAGLHPYTLPGSIKDGWDIFVQNSLRHLGKNYRERAVKANTKATVAAIANNPRLDILSHPGLFFKVDIREVAAACVKHNVLFEINCGHKHPDISDIIEAKQVGVNFIINSDAHFQETVGKLDYGSWIVNQAGIDEKKVVNNVSGGGYAQWGKKMKAYAYLS